MRKPYGSLHRLTTRAGSHVTIDNRRDEFGRGSSHVVTGYINGRSAYYLRNVPARAVPRAVRNAERQGWTGIAASVEGF